METLYPKSGKQTQVVCFPKEHLKPCDPRCRRETLTHMFMGRQCSVQSWCRFTGLSDSLPRSKPTGEPQTKPDIRLSVINTVLFRTLTNVCLLLPPSLLRRHLPLASPPASCAPAVLGTCLNFLSTSDLQMNCMLRSSSTKPLARSWTMPSTTWHLCRWPPAVSLCFAFPSPVFWALFSFLPCCCLWIMCLLLSSSCGESIKVCATPRLYVCHLFLHTSCHLCTTKKNSPPLLFVGEIYHMLVKCFFQFLF